MAVPTRQELIERIEELEEENETLQGRLDEIADLVATDEEDSEEDKPVATVSEFLTVGFSYHTSQIIDPLHPGY